MGSGLGNEYDDKIVARFKIITMGYSIQFSLLKDPVFADCLFIAFGRMVNYHHSLDQ